MKESVNPVDGTDSLADGGITGLSFLEGISLQELELNWDRDDVENVIKLIYETVQSVKEGETFSYFG